MGGGGWGAVPGTNVSVLFKLRNEEIQYKLVTLHSARWRGSKQGVCCTAQEQVSCRSGVRTAERIRIGKDRSSQRTARESGANYFT
jgi:hypothetical protein